MWHKWSHKHSSKNCAAECCLVHRFEHRMTRARHAYGFNLHLMRLQSRIHLITKGLEEQIQGLFLARYWSASWGEQPSRKLQWPGSPASLNESWMQQSADGNNLIRESFATYFEIRKDAKRNLDFWYRNSWNKITKRKLKVEKSPMRLRQIIDGRCNCNEGAPKPSTDNAIVIH